MTFAFFFIANSLKLSNRKSNKCGIRFSSNKIVRSFITCAYIYVNSMHFPLALPFLMFSYVFSTCFILACVKLTLPI